MLLDEPAAALDPLSSAHIEDLIGELKNDYTTLIVTHNMQQAARVSDYTAFMYLGRLIECGETGTLFTNPERKETEDYITGRYGWAPCGRCRAPCGAVSEPDGAAPAILG